MKLSIVTTLLLIHSLTPVTVPEECTAKLKTIPLCEILADTSKYDGRVVLVRGLYRMVIHGSLLIGSSVCADTEVNLRGASDYVANKRALAVIRSLTRKNEFQTVDVVLRGTFHVAAKGHCFGQICASYEVEDHELLCAKAPKLATGLAEKPAPENPK